MKCLEKTLFKYTGLDINFRPKSHDDGNDDIKNMWFLNYLNPCVKINRIYCIIQNIQFSVEECILFCAL